MRRFVFLLAAMLMPISQAFADCSGVSVLIMSPYNNSAVTTPYSVNAMVLMYSPVAPITQTATVYLDGAVLSNQNCPGTGCSISLSGLVSTAGPHTLKIEGDCGNNVTGSQSVSFNIAASANTTPDIMVISPQENQQVGDIFPVDLIVHFQDRAPQDNYWGFVDVQAYQTDDPSNVNYGNYVPYTCSDQNCSISLMVPSAGTNVPTTLSVRATPIIAGNYSLPTATALVHLNTAPASTPVDISPDNNPREDSNVVCPTCEFGSTVNVINGVVQFPVGLFSAAGPLGTNFSLFYDSQDIDASNAETQALPYRQPLGRGWDHSYNFSLYQNPDGTVVMRGGGRPKHFYTLGQDGTFTSRTGDFSKLVVTEEGTPQVVFRDGTRYNFSAAGALTSIQDRFGKK